MAGSRYNQLWIPIAGASVNQGSDNGAPHPLSPTAYNYSQEHTPYRHHVHSPVPPFTNNFPTTTANEQRGMQSYPSEQSFHGPWQCPHLPHMNTPFAHHSNPNANPAGSFHSGYNGTRPPMNNFMESSNLSAMPFYPSPREFQGPIPGQATQYDTSLPPVNQNGTFLGRPYLAMNNLPAPMHPYGNQSPFDGYGPTNSDRHRPTAMHNRRQSHQEHHRYSNSFFDASDRRPGIPFGPQGRRSDRSISPRTSAARRNFDRFSQDLGRASTSADADEAAARVPPNQRSRHRPREARPRFYSQSQPFDPNIPTTRQLQALKDRLQRRLPSELPEVTSRMCDICQKDYSETWVNPTEEQEIVIELPCGHCFGEFCIFEWFDTCRTHKNKITCPMCRKQLIEPPRYHPALLNVLSRGGPAIQDIFASELRGEFAHV